MCLPVLLWVGCKDPAPVSSSASGRVYYLDVNGMSGQGKVYVFEPVNDSLLPLEYWHRRYAGDLRRSILHSRLLTPDRQVLLQTEEQVNMDGALLTGMEIALSTPEGVRVMSRATISEGTTFLFGDPDPSVVARYKIEYREPGPDSVRVILTRVRRYVGTEQYIHHTQQAFAGRKYVVQETLETETEGFTESTWETTEIYVPEWGLVYYKKTITPTMILEYRLREIIKYEDFAEQGLQ